MVWIANVFFICGIVLVCKLNVHKRCEKNVANNCGINTKDMAKILQEIGIFGDIVNTSKIRKKVNNAFGIHYDSMILLMI